MLKPPNVETTLVEQNLPVKAIFELPFKVTMENKLRCFQYKVIHNILPTNNRTHLENWRPISLANVDTKIASKVIATRITEILPEIIHSNQTGYV